MFDSFANRFVFLGEIALGLVWLYSSILHFLNPYRFLESVLLYQVIPANSFAWVFAGSLIFLTLTLGASLISKIFREGSLIVSLVVLTCFVAAQINAYAQGLQIGCGCFGASSEVIGWKSISITVMITVLNLVLVVFEFHVAKKSGYVDAEHLTSQSAGTV